MIKCRRTTQHANGVITGYFVGDPCFGKTAIIGRPHKPKIRLRMLPETHPVYGPYYSCTNVEDVPAAKNKNIMLFITQIGRLKGEQLENSAS